MVNSKHTRRRCRLHGTFSLCQVRSIARIDVRITGLQQAQADGSLTKLLKQLQKARLLILDDLGIASVGPKQYRDFLEILDDRKGCGSTLITSQFPVAQWHEIIADGTVADAILDRLVHNAYRLELKGESLRKTKDRKPDGTE